MERSEVDILAARKRAAERARSEKMTDADPAEPAAPQPQEESATPAPLVPKPEEQSFPPLPDTAFDPDDLLAEPVHAVEPEAGAQEDASSHTVPPKPGPAAEQRPQQPAAASAAPVAEIEAEQSAPERESEMLAFLLGSEEYVVPVEQVREILTPKEITPVPHTADYLLGVCSLRGTVMPVIDLNRRLGIAASDRDEKSRIIVVSLGQDDQVGLFVDRVRGVVRFLPSAVRPAPETVAQGAGAEYLQGIARKNDHLYILLHTEKAIGA